jgi:putative ABC transport system substrate-binding protein
VAILGNSNNPGDAQALRETVIAAGTVDVYLRYLDVLDPKEIESKFTTANKGHADAVLVLGNPILNAHRKRIVELAVKHRLPTAYTRPEYIDEGGLMYYGTNYNDLFRRAAGYVDRILKGETAANLPVQAPTKYELVINLKTAKTLGLDVPPSLLARADEVIE